jgi:hypothetical protein
MHGNRLGWIGLFALMLVACNLSTAPPTPTLAPATEIPLFFPSVTPLPGLDGANPTTSFSLTPNAPIEGLNPNCPQPPGWVTYTVEPGDSMGLLAQQTDSSISELTQANCLDNPDQIYVGQVLYVPRTPVVSQ